eukprot:gene25567-34130_t
MACKWRQKISEFLEDKASSNDSVAKVFSHIETLLDSLQYPEHVRHCSTDIDAAIQNRNMMYTSGISSQAAVRRLLSRDDGSSYDSSAIVDNREIFNAFRNSTTSTCTPAVSSAEGSFSDYIGHINRRSRFVKNSSICSTIVIYQTLNAFTGGTIAMRLLYETLLTAGYVDAVIHLNSSSSSSSSSSYSSSCVPSVILCNDSSIASSEQMFLACTQPKDQDIAVTGEWCNEVLAAYLALGNASKPFEGRGVQYFLGFHHAGDRCKGWISVGDSHFITKLMSERVLGAYYLGCPMTELFQKSFRELSQTHQQQVIEEEEKDKIVFKENLIVMDVDFLRDYGASSVDFPGVHRVDHLNGSDVSRVVRQVADRFEEELHRPGNKDFLRVPAACCIQQKRFSALANFTSFCLREIFCKKSPRPIRLAMSGWTPFIQIAESESVTCKEGGFVDLTLSGSLEGPAIFLANGFFPSDPFPIAGPRVDLTEEWFEYHHHYYYDDDDDDDVKRAVVGAVTFLSTSYPKRIFKSIEEIMNHHHSITTPPIHTSGSNGNVGRQQEVIHVCDVLLSERERSGKSSRLVYDVRNSHPWMSLQLFHREMSMSMTDGLKLCT